MKDSALRHQLEALAAIHGRSLSLMPEASVMRLDEPGGTTRWFSLLRNTGHSNVDHLMDEMKALLPDENTLTVVPGFIGAYPNALYVVARAELPDFTAAVQSLSSESDYRALADRFAIRRSNPAFWTYIDALQDANANLTIGGAALLDYNRFEDR